MFPIGCGMSSKESIDYEPIMWGLVDQGGRTFLIVMYAPLGTKFRFAAIPFDSDGELYERAISEWWYDAENQEFTDKAEKIVYARRSVFAMMVDLLGREVFDVFGIRDRVIPRAELKRLYKEGGGITVYGGYNMYERLRRKHLEAAGLGHYGPEPI